MISKYLTFMELLSTGAVVRVHFSPNYLTVAPEQFLDETNVIFEYGASCPIPIPDLEVDDMGISATLSFARAPHPTFVPWEAVFAIGTQDGAVLRVWTNSAPDGFDIGVPELQRPTLTEVPLDLSDDAPSSYVGPPALRLVK